jgi:hypothetical protein
MASTYSNLKFQLMATGENSTTWGDVTNINLGTAIEEAIVGSADVTFSSANVTLTLTDTNTSQTARNMRLRLTGTTGGARTLTVPPIEKVYIVTNDCADTVVVRASAGVVTTVGVPAGKTMWLYSDGANVANAVSHLSTLTLGTDLAVADGGTGASTAADARTNLGLGTIATQNSNAVAITGGSITGITDLAVADGGTGASTAADARTNLGLGSLAVLSSINNSNWSGTALAVTNGGTGAVDAPTARSNLGAGTVNSVGGTGTVNGLTLTGTVTSSGSLTLGGTLSGVSLTTQVSGTLPIANGGTNATTASDARTALGLAIGTDVPSPTGTGASGSWNINAATATSATNATNATNAANLIAANFSIVESGGVLYFKYGATNIAKLESNGAFTALNNVTGFGSI